ncbi:MAG: hypothetical protein HYW06_02065, partial [Gemmatimonadetes bacterium]|nr:hypothetical protein [Gemmatimonadota bacterium]
MRRLFKFLLIAALLALGFAAYSYLGARFTAGRLLGPDPALTGRTVAFSAPLQRNFVGVPKDQTADPAFPAGYAIRGRDARP